MMLVAGFNAPAEMKNGIPLWPDGAPGALGNSTNDKIEVKLPKKPKRVLINAYHDVLEM